MNYGDQWLAEIIAEQEAEEAREHERRRDPAWPGEPDPDYRPARTLAVSGTIGETRASEAIDSMHGSENLTDGDREILVKFATQLSGGHARRGPADDVVAAGATRARETIGEKVEHVRRAVQTREHACHWPDCKEQVKPAVWGCRRHWYMLPRILRDKIWSTYRSGQENTMTPSRAYVEVAREVQAWILVNRPVAPNPRKLSSSTLEYIERGAIDEPAASSLPARPDWNATVELARKRALERKQRALAAPTFPPRPPRAAKPLRRRPGYDVVDDIPMLDDDETPDFDNATIDHDPNVDVDPGTQ